MNSNFTDDCVFPIINVTVPDDPILAALKEPYYWAGQQYTQYPFPARSSTALNLLALSHAPEAEAAGLVSHCDSIGDLSIRAVVFQDPDSNAVYRRFLAEDRFRTYDDGRAGVLTDKKGNITVRVNPESGVAEIRSNPIVIGVYFGGYRYDCNRRSTQ